MTPSTTCAAMCDAVCKQQQGLQRHCRLAKHEPDEVHPTHGQTLHRWYTTRLPGNCSNSNATHTTRQREAGDRWEGII
jgi:hypothetical protein